MLRSLALLLTLTLPCAAWALPNQISQEGLLLDNEGDALEGEHDLRIRLWDREAGGNVLFEEQHRDIELFGGWYSIDIGSIEDLAPALFGRDDLYMSLAVDAGGDLSPRTPLLKVPAAFHADVAINAVGDITPNTVSVGGNTVIDENGRWVGDRGGLQGAQGPRGPQGPAGAEGGDGSPDGPEDILEKLAEVDGDESGLDADLLDGLHADRFMRVDQDTGTTGHLSTDKELRAAQMRFTTGTGTLTWGGNSNGSNGIMMRNRNLIGVNSLHIEDPGPSEGLIFNGTGAKVVVSPPDDANRDGALRLINDGGIRLEDDVVITGALDLAGASPTLSWRNAQGACCHNAVDLRNRNVVGANHYSINDPGPDGAIIWTGTQAKIYVSSLGNGNGDGYLRLINDDGISLESDVVRTSANLYVTGNLGVGTTDPASKAEIRDDSAVETGLTVRNWRANSNSRPYLTLLGITPRNQQAWGRVSALTGVIAGGSDNARHGGLAFDVSTGNNGAANRAMTIQHDGDTGIGTNAPLGRLHVNGADSRSNPVVIGSVSPGLYFYDTETQNNALRYDSFGVEVDGSKFYIGSRARADAATPGGTTRNFTIQSDGKVGIGTRSPTATLHVNGDIKANNFTGPAITNNRAPKGLEHNLLFNAHLRFKVTQSGPPVFSLGSLFDGKMGPNYPGNAPTANNPGVVLIENLPASHTQAGAWVGWSTRYWPARRFKIEGFNTYANPDRWDTIANFQDTDYTASDFLARMPSGGYSKLRFTFYTATGADGRIGVSELFFIHPEAVRPYEGLLAAAGADGFLRGPVMPSNRSTASLEHNLLFNAHLRFDVEQSGPAGFNLGKLFDGRMAPDYPGGSPTAANPQVVTINGLPGNHTQAGAWIGWTTRYWQPRRFKIEGLNSYRVNEWQTIADYENEDYSGADFMVKMRSGVFRSIRYTIYSATGANGRVGISELFFIHPEAARPYEGLLQTQGSSDCFSPEIAEGEDIGDVLKPYLGRQNCISLTLARDATYTWNTSISVPARTDLRINGSGWSNGANNITSRIEMRGARVVSGRRCVNRLVTSTFSTFTMSGVYIDERINDNRALYQSSTCRALFNAGESSVLTLNQLRGEFSEDVANFYGHQHARIKFGWTFFNKTGGSPRDINIVKADSGWNFAGHGGIVSRSHTRLGGGVTWHDSNRIRYLD